MIKSSDKTEYVYSYAQNREDILINGFLGDVRNGFYVDVGANHPVVDSVTKIFYDQGWSGINIEPIHDLFLLLNEVRNRDINLNIAISNQEGKESFRQYTQASGLSTFSNDIKNEYQSRKNSITDKYIEYKVQVRELKNVFKDNNVSVIHFMKVDVEGFENNVLQSNDWDKFRPWVLCIEANHTNSDWVKLLGKNKYTFVFNDGINKYFVANEQIKRAEKFSYESAILSKPILQRNIKEILDNEVFLRKVSENTSKRREAENQYLKSELNRLHNVIAQSQGFKRSIKQVARSFDNAIKTYIENMNKPRIKQVAKLTIDSKVKSVQKLLDQARKYDFDRFYSKRSNVRLSYRIVRKSYMAVTRVPLGILRKARLVIRRKA